MKRDKDARDDIRDTEFTFRIPVWLRYTLLYAGLFALCKWGYETNHNRGVLLTALCIVGLCAWHGIRYLRNGGWFPGWQPKQAKIVLPFKPAPTDGAPLDDYEQQKFKDILSHNGYGDDKS